MNKTEYITIYSDTTEKFDKILNEHVEAGWIPVWNIVIGSNQNGVTICQQLQRIKKQEGEA